VTAVRSVRQALVVAATMLLVAACGTQSSGSKSEAGAEGGSSAVAQPITVFAAASLTDAFIRIGADFTAASGSPVTFSFGSSATLATQISSGAPADVFAAASPATMKTVVDAGGAAAPVDFVSNTLQIAVPRGNPAEVTGLADFADDRRTFALCAPQVPCGAAAEQVFAAAGITPKPDTLEQDVKAALAKVVADEVDAALVYRTDVLAAAGDVEGIDFPEAAQAANAYPIAVLTASKASGTAQSFVDHVLSPEGQAVLARAGFAKP
jgi:molybdate transport system substrate-binding protein